MSQANHRLDRPAFRSLTRLGLLAQCVALVGVSALAEWIATLRMAAFLGVSLGFVLMPRRMPALLELLVVAAATGNAIGWTLGFFERFAIWDEFVHLSSAFALMAALAFLRWRSRAPRPVRVRASDYAAVVGAGLAIGAVWEAAEFFVLDFDWAETLSDLLMDAIGAALAVPVAARFVNLVGPPPPGPG